MDAGIIALNIVFILAGFALLYFGGDFLVDGACALAKKLNIPTIVIGLTVVAFGTSAPEVFVSVISVIKGEMSVSLGNVLGSNIMNTALILGFAATIMPIATSKRTAIVDTPIMLGAYGVLYFAITFFNQPGTQAGYGDIIRVEGGILVALLIAYVIFLYRTAKGHDYHDLEEVHVEEIDKVEEEPLNVSIPKIVGGLIGLAIGAELLVRGSTFIARDIFHVSERFIGLTIVAMGTSLPEFVTSVVAVVKKEMDISLGNIIGSNIFNTLLVVGTAALVRPLEIRESFGIDYIIMVALGLFLFVMLLAKKKVTRAGGIVFLVSYAAYLTFLIMTR